MISYEKWFSKVKQKQKQREREKEKLLQKTTFENQTVNFK